jgi:DNA adenine methylase
MISFFRYPGGKSKLRNSISEHLNVYANKLDLEYREPFFGGGSVGLKFISDNPQWKKVWINDKDLGVANLWTSVIRFPNELKKMVQDFKPSIEIFDKYKLELLSNSTVSQNASEIVLHGFKKLAIHQISYSGLGTKSGGPLGGREQKSKYKIDCRWSPDYICKKIDKLHNQFSKLEIKHQSCTSFDFEDLVNSTENSFIYLDPPYYIKGNELYQFGFTKEDHKKMADVLKYTNHPWILSYDDCPEVRRLYSWAEINIIYVNYSITATKDKQSGNRFSRNKSELLIFSKKHKESYNAWKNLFAENNRSTTTS